MPDGRNSGDGDLLHVIRRLPHRGSFRGRAPGRRPERAAAAAGPAGCGLAVLVAVLGRRIARSIFLPNAYSAMLTRTLDRDGPILINASVAFLVSDIRSLASVIFMPQWKGCRTSHKCFG